MGTPDALEVPVTFGGPSRTRTLDPLTKSCSEPRTHDTHSARRDDIPLVQVGAVTTTPVDMPLTEIAIAVLPL